MNRYRNKKIYLPLVGFLFIFIVLFFTPLYTVHAIDVGAIFGAVGDTISDAVQSLIETAVFGLLNAFTSLTVLILQFVVGILKYVMSSDFNNGIIRQPFVQEGWALVRDFANMFFVVVLVVIAIATMLRQEAFGIRNTLPTLIIIALLVNFSLILVGFVIDVSQVFMVYFLKPFEQDGKDLGTLLANSANFDKVFSSNIDFTSQMSSWEELGIRFFIKILGILALIFEIFVVGAIAVLFIIRTVFLWVVAILAPLAFVAYILPQTRSAWNRWFKTLTDWALFGPVAMFFLFLTGKLMDELQGPMASFGSGAAGIGERAGGNEFLGHGTAFIQAAAVFVFLILAMNAAKMFTGAIGAAVVGKMEGYRRATVGALTAPGRAAGRAAVRGAKRKAAEEAAKRGARPAGWGARTTEQIAAGEHALGKLPLGLGWAARTAARQARQPLRDLEMRAGQVIDTKQKDLSRNKDTAVIGALDAAVEPMEKIAAAREAASRGILDQSKLKKQDLLAIMEEAAKYDRHKELGIARPDLLPETREWKDWRFDLAKKGLTPQQLNEEEEKRMTTHMSKYSSQQAAQLSAEAMADERVQEGIVKGWGNNQAAALTQNGTNAQIGAFEEAIRNATEGATTFEETLGMIERDYKNPRLAKALRSNPTLSTLNIREGGPSRGGGGGTSPSGSTLWTPPPGGHKLTDEELAERRRTGAGEPPPGESPPSPLSTPTPPSRPPLPPRIPNEEFRKGGKYPGVPPEEFEKGGQYAPLEFPPKDKA